MNSSFRFREVHRLVTRAGLVCSLCAASSLAVAQVTTASPPPEIRIHTEAPRAERTTADASADKFAAYPRYFQDTSDLLVRRAEDGVPRSPNPNGSAAGTTPGLSKNNYVVKTYPIHNANAIDIQSYLLRSLTYEGGIAEVCANKGMKDPNGHDAQFLIVTAPDFMIPGLDDTISKVDVAGFSFNDGTSNPNAKGQSGATAYRGKHRTAGELKAILMGTELGNIGQFYYAPFADNALNQIYLSENPTDIADDLAALDTFDKPPLQAEFDVQIYEVEKDNLDDLGLDWDAWKRAISGSFTYSSLDSSHKFFDKKVDTFSTLLTLDASVLADFLNYLSKEGKADVVTQTKILSVNAEDNPGALSSGAKGTSSASPATFQSIRVIPFSKVETPTGVLSDSRVVDVIDPTIFEGIKVSIQPFIATESVTANVEITVNSLIGFTREARIPNIATRQTHNLVNLANGVTQLLGSFDKETVAESRLGIPGLKDIPYIKYLFSRETELIRSSKLVVLITPHIVDAKTETKDAMAQAAKAKE